MGEERRIADRGMRNAECGRVESLIRIIANRSAAEDRHQGFNIRTGRRFIERDTDRVIANSTQIAAGTRGPFDKITARTLPKFESNRVEEIFVSDFETELAQ